MKYSPDSDVKEAVCRSLAWLRDTRVRVLASMHTAMFAQLRGNSCESGDEPRASLRRWLPLSAIKRIHVLEVEAAGWPVLPLSVLLDGSAAKFLGSTGSQSAWIPSQGAEVRTTANDMRPRARS